MKQRRIIFRAARRWIGLLLGICVVYLLIVTPISSFLRTGGFSKTVTMIEQRDFSALREPLTVSICLYGTLLALSILYLLRQWRNISRSKTTIERLEQLRTLCVTFKERTGRFPNSASELEMNEDVELCDAFKKRPFLFLSSRNIGIVASTVYLGWKAFVLSRRAFLLLDDGSIVMVRGRAVSSLFDKVWASETNADLGKFYAPNGQLKFKPGSGYPAAFCSLSTLIIAPLLAFLMLVLAEGTLAALEPIGRATQEVYWATLLYATVSVAYLLVFASLAFLALGAYTGWLHWRYGDYSQGKRSTALLAPYVMALFVLFLFIGLEYYINGPSLFYGGASSRNLRLPILLANPGIFLMFIQVGPLPLLGGFISPESVAFLGKVLTLPFVWAWGFLLI